MYRSGYIKSKNNGYNTRKIGKFIDKYFYTITFIFILICLLGGITLVIIKEFFNNDDVILKHSFENTKEGLFEEKEVKKLIINSTKDKNYYNTTLFSKAKIKENIKEIFPFIEDINFKKNTNTLITSIEQKNPEIILQGSGVFFGTIDNNLFILKENFGISGKNIPLIFIDQNIFFQNQFSGIFFHISAKELKEIVSDINKYIPSYNKITYNPGAKRLIITNNNQIKIIFNLTKSLEEQLKKLDILKKNYLDFYKAKEIDLGSLEHIILKQ